MHRPDEVRDLLRRATEIDASASADTGMGLSDDEVVEAARAAGVSETAVRQAIAERRLRPGASTEPGKDAPWVVTRRVPTLTDGQRAEMFSTIRRAAPYRSLGRSVEVEAFGSTEQVALDQAFGGAWARLRVGPADAGHDTWTYEHHPHADVARLGWIVPLVASVPVFLVVAGVMVAFEPPDWMGFVAIAILVALSALLVPTLRRRILRKRRRQVDDVTRQLDALAAPRPVLRLDDLDAEQAGDADAVVPPPRVRTRQRP